MPCAAGTAKPSALSTSPNAREPIEARLVFPRGDLVVTRRGRLEVMDTTAGAPYGASVASTCGAQSREWRSRVIAATCSFRSFMASRPRSEEVDLATGHRVTLADAISPTVSPAKGRRVCLHGADTRRPLPHSARRPGWRGSSSPDSAGYASCCGHSPRVGCQLVAGRSPSRDLRSIRRTLGRPPHQAT